VKVVDAAGQFVGFAKDIREQKLIIGRPSAPDVEVPLRGCQMTSDRVRLSLSSDQVDRMPWRTPYQPAGGR
jgi:hypothetical protein